MQTHAKNPIRIVALATLAVTLTPTLAAAQRCRDDPDAIYRVPAAGAPAVGAETPLVTMVLFHDYQCPYCAMLSATLLEAVDRRPDDLRLVFRQMPLPFHREALPAARAALVAASQGRFRDFHERLLEERSNLSRETIERVAGEAGLNLRKLREALDGRGGTVARVEADVALAEALGVTGTPTLFVNGRKQVGARDAEAIATLLDAEIEAARAAIAAGTPRSRLYDDVMARGVDRPACLPDDAPPPSPRPAPPPPPPAPPQDVRIDSWTEGTGSIAAPITLVVFTEHLCPFCARLESTVAQLLERYPGRIRVLYRYKVVHAEAEIAVRAVLAAALQGRQMDLQRALFENRRDARDLEGVIGIAKSIGLNGELLRADMESDEIRRRAAAEEAEAQRLRVTGTPTTFVNGRRVTGAQPVESFVVIIEELLGNTPAP